ncbi:MAG: DUF4621 domain-containing protein [Bacteroidales bacterium]
MKLKLLPAITILVLSTMSCIDQSWDLSKVKNDEILLFTEGVTLPGGNIQTIRFDKEQLDKLLPDMTENLIQKGNQIFINYVTDTNQINTDEMREQIFESITFGQTKPVTYPASGSGGTIPAGKYAMIKKEIQAVDPSVNIGEYIKRLDLVTLDNGYLTIDISQTGFNSKSAEDHIEFKVLVPDEITLNEIPDDEITTIDKTIYFQVAFSAIKNGQHKLIKIPIKQIYTPLNIKPFIVESTLVSTGIPYSSGAKIILSMTPDINDKNIDRIEGKFTYEFKDIEMPIENKILEQLYDAFGEDAIIDFYAPQLILKTNSSFTAASIMNLQLNYETKAGSIESEKININISASPTNQLMAKDYLLGTRVESDPSAGLYTFDLTKVLKEGRRNLTITATVKLDETPEKQVLYNHMEARINAVFETPFIFGKDLKADINEQKDKIFDQKTIDLLFSAENSEVYIEGDVTKEIPLNVKLNIDVLDENNQPVGVLIADVLLTDEATQKIQFTVSKDDAPKMIRARNLLIKGNVFSDENLAGQIITVEDFVNIQNLKIRKKGGVIIKP